MAETKRFIRYVIPGLLFMAEFSLFLFLSNPHSFYDKVRELSNIGFPIMVFVGSGGIGFLFSIFHHFLYWHVYIYLGKRPALCCDHREMLINAEKQSFLILHLQNGTEIEANKLSTAGAWRVINAIWDRRKEASKEIKGSIESSTYLSDLMHSTGTALVACLVAVCLSIIILGSSLYEFSNHWWIAYIISVAILIITHFFNYCMVVKHTQGVTNSLALDEFYLNYQKEKKPIITFVTEAGIDKLNFIKKIKNRFSKSINKSKK
jgi:low affinity Fe/Cu permease